VSLSGAFPLRFEIRPGTLLPSELLDLGYPVRYAGQSHRLVSGGSFIDMETYAIGMPRNE
jgi:hypothetical protein